jgi:hyperosmotically inducible periplasmic protein
MNNHSSNTDDAPAWSVWFFAIFIAVAILLAACSDAGDPRTVGQKLDSAIASTEKSVVEAKQVAKEAASDAKVAIKDATENAKAVTAQASSEASSALKAATEDLGTKADDALITTSVTAGLAKDPDLSAIKIEVETKGGNVSLYGAAANAGARDRATLIAQSVKGVKSVDNKLSIKS